MQDKTEWWLSKAFKFLQKEQLYAIAKLAYS